MKTCHSIANCNEEKMDIFKKNGYLIKGCMTCGYRYCLVENTQNHVEKVYADSYFFDGKEGYPNYLEEKEILIQHGVRYAKVISKYVERPGVMLDIGCAAGFMLKGFETLGWRCKGLEPNKTMADYGRTELNLDIAIGSLESYNTNEKFDLITMIQVIGHFHNIDKAIQYSNELLKPGGFILVESWNMNNIIARVLKKNWQEYSPPSVIQWFSDKTLVDLFDFYDLKLVTKGFPVKYINLKHAFSLLSSKMPNLNLIQKFFKMLEKSMGSMKVYYPPIDLKWYLFQKGNI